MLTFAHSLKDCRREENLIWAFRETKFCVYHIYTLYGQKYLNTLTFVLSCKELIWSGYIFCCDISYHSIGKAINQFLECCTPFLQKSGVVVSSVTSVGQCVLTCTQHSNSSHKYSVGLKSGL